MLRRMILGFRRRRAISTIIGGLIILSLILTALGTMVAISQQYNQYQQTAEKMGQYEDQESLEKIAVNSPGLATVTSTTTSGWGSGCVSTYNCYNMSLSNLSGVGIQIVRLYINSTGSGCTTPCVLNPSQTIAADSFNLANQYINPGEVNHAVVLALPNTITLPDPNPAVPENTIIIVTSRGNVFSFQWPVPLQVYGQSQSAFSSGTMKIAYAGSGSGSFDSKNEPAAGGSGTAATGYCHTEGSQPYPAAAGYAEKLGSTSNPIPGLPSGDNGALWFVNPWVTYGSSDQHSILSSIDSGSTTLYIYVLVINTGQVAYAPSAGSIDLTWYSANHLHGDLLGIYYKGTFSAAASAPSITPGTSYYAIYQISTAYSNNPPSSSTMYWGDASVTNGSGSNAENQNYFSGTVLLPGLWIRYEPSTGSC